MSDKDFNEVMRELEKAVEGPKGILQEETSAQADINPGQFTYPDLNTAYGYALKVLPHQLELLMNKATADELKQYKTYITTIQAAEKTLDKLIEAYDGFRDLVKESDYSVEARDIERIMTFLRDSAMFLQFYTQNGFEKHKEDDED